MLTDTRDYWYFRQQHRGLFLALRAAIMICVILDTIRRVWFGSSPAERVLMALELPVTLFIGIEFVAFVIHGWRERRRKRRARKILERLTIGQKIQADAPKGSGASREAVAAWESAANQWTDQTNALLSRYSASASVSFLHSKGGANVSFGHGHINPYAQHAFIDLQERLNNLRSILESPDVYL